MERRAVSAVLLACSYIPMPRTERDVVFVLATAVESNHQRRDDEAYVRRGRGLTLISQASCRSTALDKTATVCTRGSPSNRIFLPGYLPMRPSKGAFERATRSPPEARDPRGPDNSFRVERRSTSDGVRSVASQTAFGKLRRPTGGAPSNIVVLWSRHSP